MVAVVAKVFLDGSKEKIRVVLLAMRASLVLHHARSNNLRQYAPQKNLFSCRYLNVTGEQRNRRNIIFTGGVVLRAEIGRPAGVYSDP